MRGGASSWRDCGTADSQTLLDALNAFSQVKKGKDELLAYLLVNLLDLCDTFLDENTGGFRVCRFCITPEPFLWLTNPSGAVTVDRSSQHCKRKVLNVCKFQKRRDPPLLQKRSHLSVVVKFQGASKSFWFPPVQTSLAPSLGLFGL